MLWAGYSYLKAWPKDTTANEVRRLDGVGEARESLDRTPRKKPGRKPSPRVHQLHPKVFMQYLAKPKSWESFKANLLKKCGKFTEALLNQGSSTAYGGLKLPFRASHSGRGTIKI